MKIRTIMTAIIVTILGSAGVVWAVPEVSDVTMSQRANSRIVDIGYTLTGEEAIITLGIETNGVALPNSAVKQVSGDVCRLIQTGDRSIIWNAGADWPEHSVTNAKARVTAWQTNSPPLYCVVDLVDGTAATSYPVTYYVSADAVPGGVTNDLYKTTRLAMRKISATGVQGFKMGSQPGEAFRESGSESWHDVVLTKDYYAGVYQVTQCQWHQVMGDLRSWPANWRNEDYRLMRPLEKVSYYDIRENYNNTDDPAVDWPANTLVTANSFMGRMRAKTDMVGFDLPTDAQWEYACRAGTSGSLNDGTVNLTNTLSDARMDLLGRYKYNGGFLDPVLNYQPATDCTTENATMVVGAYLPNTWGLYDMHGNVRELCLDWYEGNLGTAAVTDPSGTNSGSARVVRGGSWNRQASSCRSAYRSSGSPSDRNDGVGFRLVRTIAQ